MGSEDRGVKPICIGLLTKSEASMFGTIGSLNVSVACGAFIRSCKTETNPLTYPNVKKIANKKGIKTSVLIPFFVENLVINCYI
jgi:hypothetical protein